MTVTRIPSEVIEVPDFVTMTEPEPDKPMAELAVALVAMFTEDDTLPQPRYLSLSVTGQEIDMQFGTDAGHLPRPGPVGGQVRRHRHRLAHRRRARRTVRPLRGQVRLRRCAGEGVRLRARHQHPLTNPVPGRGNARPRPGPITNPSTSRNQQQQGETHASQHRVDVLGPPDALAPRRHHPGRVPRLAGRTPAPWPGWTGTRSPPTCTRSPASTPTAASTTSPSRAGRRSAAPTPERSCRSTRTPTPSSTTAKWARSSKRSSPSRT